MTDIFFMHPKNEVSTHNKKHKMPNVTTNVQFTNDLSHLNFKLRGQIQSHIVQRSPLESLVTAEVSINQSDSGKKKKNLCLHNAPLSLTRTSRKTAQKR